MSSYDIAAFLAHNHLALKKSSYLVDAYTKASRVDSLEQARDLILDALTFTVRDYFKDLPIQEIQAILEEDKVNTILHTLFLKGYYYEH